MQNSKGGIPEYPPEPCSLWIDIHPINDFSEQIVPEYLPNPPSIFLNLHWEPKEAESSD
ncbi:hypothetical protein FIBSPDRAFT_825546 [Athelia psychrophila]|uniref:Uncharacterized protein n=1 Tax=Athelia psychrophila TaxID=1759441 RepID=A0A166K592_9AGAM|nr:hypothetical protein FIBSPDRAFT_825546 [Fibularhizoctonia sp. CBS 109695]